MKKFIKKTKLLFIIFLFVILILFLNKKTTQQVVINNKIIENKIPIYLKINNHWNRHQNYKHLVKNINFNQKNLQNRVINTARWVNLNIKKIPPGVDLIDSDPLTIAERRLGAQYQFSDLLSVLLIYLDIETIFYNHTSHQLTLFKINDSWSVLDPYYGVYFVNDDKEFASIENLKNTNWEIVNYDSEKIDTDDISNFFLGMFDSYDEIKEYYQKIFVNLQSSQKLNKINIFDRSGRGYIQKPLNRIKYELYKFFYLK